MAYTVQQIIDIAKVSQYLATNNIEEGVLFGRRIDKKLNTTIYMERKAVEWMYLLSANEKSLKETSAYLFAICYNPGYSYTVSTRESGEISPVISITRPKPYYFVVTDTSFMVNGQDAKTIPAFQGFNLLFTRGGIPQSTITTEDSYFTWDNNTCVFTCYPALVTGELIGLIPV